MANEIINSSNNNAVEVIDEVKPNYNRNLGDKVIPLSIKCTKRINAKTKKPFIGVKVYKFIEVINDEGVSEGKKNRWLDLHFITDAFKTDKGEGCCVSDINDLTTGILYVKAKYIQSPRKYIVKEATDDEGNVIYNDDGSAKLQYPEVWIKGGIMGFEAWVEDEDDYLYHAPSHKKEDIVDAETGEVLSAENDDEEETRM